MAKIPTIKGIFVNSHIKALKAERGEAGIRQLEQKFGRPIKFKSIDAVPVSDEIKIIEYTLDILSDHSIPVERRAFEAGRLHCKNFMGTPYARIIFGIFTDYRNVILRAKFVAEYVFNGICFSVNRIDKNNTHIIMEGGEYPLDHFKGFFWEWMARAGDEPDVQAQQKAPEVYEYMLHWKNR